MFRAVADQSDDVRHGLIIWIAKALVGMPLIGIVLFACAGTIHWVGGWVFFILGLLAVTAHFLTLLRVNPALLAERSKGVREEGAPRWDRILVTLAAAVFPYAGWILSAFDYRFGWTTWMPVGLRIGAVVVFILAWALILWSTVANRFFTATVHIQPNHQVADSGPYAHTRHPGYAGAILYYTSSPLILGSWWGMLPTLAADVCVVIRTAMEDRFLHDNLTGYPEYAARVRYRLLPHAW